MSGRHPRNLIPPVYGVEVAIGFMISATVGLVVLIARAMISAMLWTALSRGARR